MGKETTNFDEWRGCSIIEPEAFDKIVAACEAPQKANQALKDYLKRAARAQTKTPPA